MNLRDDNPHKNNNREETLRILSDNLETNVSALKTTLEKLGFNIGDVFDCRINAVGKQRYIIIKVHENRIDYVRYSRTNIIHEDSMTKEQFLDRIHKYVGHCNIDNFINNS